MKEDLSISIVTPTYNRADELDSLLRIGNNIEIAGIAGQYRGGSQIQPAYNFDIVVLDVKPQVTKKVLKEYKFFSFKKTCVLISIMAGKKIIFLRKLLPNIKQIVRVMPNMPALIGEGVSCLV